MDNLPATTTKAMNSPIRSAEPSLTDKLRALVEQEDSSLVVGPGTAQELRDWLAAFRDFAMPTEDRLDTMLNRLALATKEKTASVAEVEERLRLYWRALRDIPLVDLGRGFDDLIKTKTFMPTPAEIHAAASLYTRRREWRRSRARMFIARHEREWQPPAEPLTAGEIAELRQMLALASAKAA